MLGRVDNQSQCPAGTRSTFTLSGHISRPVLCLPNPVSSDQTPLPTPAVPSGGSI